jgi:hypothetical protein
MLNLERSEEDTGSYALLLLVPTRCSLFANHAFRFEKKWASTNASTAA